MRNSQTSIKFLFFSRRIWSWRAKFFVLCLNSNQNHLSKMVEEQLTVGSVEKKNDKAEQFVGFLPEFIRFGCFVQWTCAVATHVEQVEMCRT